MCLSSFLLGFLAQTCTSAHFDFPGTTHIHKKLSICRIQTYLLRIVIVKPKAGVATCVNEVCHEINTSTEPSA